MNRVKDYHIISEILKEDYENYISDEELEKRLENVSKLALYKVMYFEYVDRKYYEKELDKQKPKSMVEFYEDLKIKTRKN